MQARGTLSSAVLATLLGATSVTPMASAAKCSWVMDTDYVPNQLGNVGVNLTRQQCCDICHNHSNCNFAVFGTAAEKIPRSCWLKADARKGRYVHSSRSTGRGPRCAAQSASCAHRPDPGARGLGSPRFCGKN